MITRPNKYTAKVSSGFTNRKEKPRPLDEDQEGRFVPDMSPPMSVWDGQSCSPSWSKRHRLLDE